MPDIPSLGQTMTRLYSEDPDCPDHLYMKVLTLARQLDGDPSAIPVALLVAIKELTHAIEMIADRVGDVHDDINWLDEHLEQVYPAWYNQED